MKKYVNPKMDINVFNAESIITASAGAQSFEDWTSAKTASTGELEFSKGVAVNMSE